jgi:lysophospholipase L1-like esterase
MKNRTLFAIAILTLLMAAFTVSAESAQYHSPILQQDYVYHEKDIDKHIVETAKTKKDRIGLAFENVTGEGLREAFMPLFADLYLGKNVDETNKTLLELFTTDDTALQEKYRLNDPWGLAFKQIAYHLYYSFGKKSKQFPGRLFPKTEKALLELLWKKTLYKNDIHIARESTWWMVGSENHDIVAKVSNLISAQIFMNEPDFKERVYPDLGTGAGEQYWFHHMYGKNRLTGPHGRANNKDGNEYTAAEHYYEWLNYFEAFFTQRAKRGFFLEMGSYGYMAVTMSYLTDIYDLVDDEHLKDKAEDFLDLAWADWAQEQLHGVRGGAKTREKLGTRWDDSMYRFGRFYTGGEGDSSSHFFAQLLSNYKWKPILWQLALDREGRGEFASIRRQPGEAEAKLPRPLGTERSMLVDTESRFVRYSWITPDYILGCQMDYPLAPHSHLSIQNRWQGMTFKGEQGPRVFPSTLKVDDSGEYQLYANGYTRCVQDKNVMIVQQSRGFTVVNPDWYPNKSRADLDYGVYIGNKVEQSVEKQGWIFVEDGDAFLAIKPIMGEYANGWKILKDEASEGFYSEIIKDSYAWSKNKELIYLKDKYAGVIFESSRREHYRTLNDFIAAILKNPIALEKTVVPGFHILKYTGLNGTEFYFNLANNEIPMVNGKSINYSPKEVFNSPFVQSDYSSGVINLKTKDRELKLDFNDVPFDQAQQKTLSIGLIGDSTVASTYGWGPAFSPQFNGKVKVLNYAKNGATLDSLSKKLDVLIKQKPRFILIQFGHNDMKVYDTKAYSKKLKDYVDRITRGGSQAIVLSSVTRRKFDENGKISPRVINDRTLSDYAQAVQTVAKAAKVPFIDLNSMSIKHHNRIGPEASAAYNFSESDKTHFSKEGAKAIADIVINELKTVVPALAGYLK